MAESLKEALEYAVGLAPAARIDDDEEGFVFTKPVFRAPHPTPPPLAQTLELATLRGFAEYVLHGVDDQEDPHRYMIHVVSPDRVELVSAVEDFHRRREVLAAAIYESPAVPYLDRWVALEDMIPGLMSAFAPSEDLTYALDLLKKVTAEDQEIREDDGLSQNVTVKAGVHVKDRVATRSPVSLAPYRTFTEVERQPSSLFILRLRAGGQVLLKSADGGAWKVPAVEAVADCLTHYIGDSPAPRIIY